MAPRKLDKKINFGISIFILHVLCMYLIEKPFLIKEKKKPNHMGHIDHYLW